MEKKNKKYDFFDQMKNYNLNRFLRFNYVILILLLVFSVPMYILLIVFVIRASSINYASFVTLWVLISINLLLVLTEFIFLIQKNSVEFIAGKLSSGLVNFVISIGVVFTVIFAVNSVLPEESHFLISAIIAAVATFFAAILALMGIHYSTIKKQEERMYRNKLVFAKDKVTDSQKIK